MEYLQAVVDAINDVVGTGFKGSEAAFVLLDQFLLLSGQSRDVVQVTHRLVWSVAGNLSGNRGVKTGHLEVNTHVGIVHVDDFTSSQVSYVVVITNSVGRHWGGQGGGTGKGRKELTTLGIQSNRLAFGAGSHKGGGGTGIREKREERVSETRCAQGKTIQLPVDSVPPTLASQIALNVPEPFSVNGTKH